MKKGMKVLLIAIIVILLGTSSISVYANQQGGGNGKQTGFKDVEKGFWAYQAISDLNMRGIISGYNDKTFKPDASITRSEFATLLANVLKLKASDKIQTFIDVKPSSWDFNAIEAIKNYLTGFRTSNGSMYFYGSLKAVREDMAIALVKALGIQVVPNNGALAKVFSDYSSISVSLQDYVYAAYINGIMKGSGGKFGPQDALTRAETATLLERVLQITEKVPVDGNNMDTDAALSNLTVNGTTTAGFNQNTLIYNVVLPAGTTIIPTVAATVKDTGKATSYVVQAPALPGNARVVVTAQDGMSWRVYSINFTIAATPMDTDATLSNLTVNGTTITGFNKNTFAYNVVLPAGTTAIPVVAAVVNDTGKATVYVIQSGGTSGNAEAVVTAQDGSTHKVYIVYFTE